MTKPKPIHPDDIAIARQIARATEFSAFLRVGPHEKYQERGLPSYEAAAKRRDQLVASHSKFGRKGLVYAINSLGSFPCDDKMMAIVADLNSGAIA